MNRLRRAREMAGFTQVELSNIIGVKHSVISRYEDESSEHRIEPPLFRIEQIAKACFVPISFLIDPQPLQPLDREQAARFRDEIKAFNEDLQRWPEEATASYKTTHPFLYMLKTRWIPTVEDVLYIEEKFGIQSKYVLNETVVNIREADKQIQAYMAGKGVVADEKDINMAFEVSRIYYSNGSSISLGEALSLVSNGVIVAELNGEKELFLSLDGVDYDAVLALVTLVNKSRNNENTPREDPEA